MSVRKLKPVHPGEVLKEEFLGPLELSEHRLALDIGVDPRRINEIVHGRRSVTANTALRLARYFNTTPQFWLGLQVQYDLDVEEDLRGARIRKEVRASAWPDGARGAKASVAGVDPSPLHPATKHGKHDQVDGSGSDRRVQGFWTC